MKAKALELRDEGTFIALLAVDMNPGVYRDDGPGLSAEYAAQRYLLRRQGYACDGRPNILITRLEGIGKASNDPYSWNDRTFTTAHTYIIMHWNEISDGDVIDVQFILGETKVPKISERLAQ